MNDKIFFDRIKASLFGSGLKPVTVTNINIILDYWRSRHSERPQAQLAYVLATVLGETGRDMKPVRETFASSDKQARLRLKSAAYAQSTPPFGHAYYGRGYVQLTWKKNYQVQEDKIGVKLVEFPDLALRAENAIVVLVEGMLAGDFNGLGHGLEYYVNVSKQDFVNARRTVNKLDRAVEIAGYAFKFLDALEHGAEAFSLIATKQEKISGAAAGDISRDQLMRPSAKHMAALRKIKI